LPAAFFTIDGPDTVFFALGNKGPQELLSQTLSPAAGTNIDAYLRHTSIDAAVGYGSKCNPTCDGVALEGNKAAVFQVRGVPFFPAEGAGLKGGIAGSQARLIDEILP